MSRQDATFDDYILKNVFGSKKTKIGQNLTIILIYMMNIKEVF